MRNTFFAIQAGLSMILDLMALAEKTLTAVGTGAEKKAYVLEALKQFVEMVGAGDSWQAIEGLFSKAIDWIAAFNFGSIVPGLKKRFGEIFG